MALAPATRIGPYEIIAPLGAGGMGEVYRARDSKLGRDVALKILPPAFAADPDRVARFRREAQVLAALNHPHIAAIYGLEDANGILALVMELVEGPTLDYRIGQGAMPLEEALPIAREIAEAVEAAHEKGIVHRDLKPANIKLTAEGRVKVLDFGLAKALDSQTTSIDQANSPTLTMSPSVAGMVLGTAAYMAPEQAKGKAVDRRADIWAFGVVLMEMLTGRPLYSGETAPETLAAVIMTDPAFDGLPASLPASIRKLLRRCLEKDPRRRLRDIGEARIAIEDMLAGKVAEEAVAPLPVAPAPARPLLAWILAAAFALAAAALGVLYFRQAPAETHAVRFSVYPPEKTTFGDLVYVGPVLISPDGLRLAFVEGESRQIRIRALDSLTASPLPGTEGAQYPFWSGDSKYIAFFADGKLKKVAISGGPPQTLCAAPNGRGGTWHGGADGVIVFAPGTPGGLSFVGAAGGEPVPITAPDAAAGEISHRQPHFLPDGRHFLYVAASTALEKSSIRVAELPGRADPKPAPVHGTRLMAGNAHVCWTPPGYLLFLRDDTLMAQPFDTVRRQFTGEPLAVAERLAVGGLRATGDFSVSDNGVLVYRSSASSANRLVWFDRQGKEIGSLRAGESYDSAALSPDGKTVAAGKVTGLEGLGTGLLPGNLRLLDIARSTVSRFTFEPVGQSSPVWSPDGKRIVYAWRREIFAELYTKDASGVGGPQLLFASKASKYPLDWSRDGRWLLFLQLGETGKFGIWALPIGDDHASTAGKPVLISQPEFSVLQGRLSPDGRFLAYTSSETNRREVYVRSFHPGEPGGGKWQVSSGGGDLAQWSRDGKEMFFIAGDGKLMVVPVKTSDGFQAGTPAALFELRTSSFEVSADGQRILAAVPAADAKAPPVTVVLNWTAGLKK